MSATSKVPLKDGMEGFVSDWASDQRALRSSLGKSHDVDFSP